MSAEPRSMKTEAEQVLAVGYRAIRDSLPGTAAVAAARDAAFARFERLGLPHRRVEAWKYTDLRARMKHAQPLAPKPTLEAAGRMHAALPTFGALARHRLVLADGYFQEALSDREALLAEGVEVVSLAEFLGLDSPAVLDVLGGPDDADDDAMIALNAAVAADGVVLLVPDGCVPSRPIEIVHLTTGGEAAAWFSRSFSRVGKGANVKLLSSHVGPDGVPSQGNSYLGLDLGEGAEVAMVDLQNEGNATQHVTTFAADLSARSVLRHVAVANGGETSRLQAFASLKGEGAWLSAAGANMLSGNEHGDINWRIDHRAPGATSRVLYKNVAADTAFGAFQGLILVRPDAQKTDGRMMTRTLLLSDEAQFAAKPELEIYADDVQCGHGATIGQIDEDALFYLMARGIPRAESMGLLVHAFLAEAVEALGDAAIGEALLPMLSTWLKDRAS